MSVVRVITRIIPLNSQSSAFEPASFDQLTDENATVGEIKVLNLTEPHSGMKYRIERIQCMQNVGPGESVESINKAYAEKLKNVPGFVELKAGDTPLNPYDKSFKLTLPKVLLTQKSDDSSNVANESPLRSFKISVVNNFNFKKASPKKKATSPVISDKPKMIEVKNNNESRSPSKSLNDPKVPFKSKYPGYLSKKLKNSVWKKKNKSPQKLQSPKRSKSKKVANGFSSKCTMNDDSKQNLSCPTSSYMKADQDLDVRKTLDRILDKNFKDETAFENHNGASIRKRKLSITDDEETDYNSLDSDSGGTLVINVIEEADVSDKSSSKDKASELLNSQTRHYSDISEDSLLGNSLDQSESSEVFTNSKNKDDGDNDSICKKFVVSESHPAHDLLVSLKKYFLNGECLICGFIPADKDFNACEHMESHILCNSFASSYKCSCCDDKFSDPRNLYMHALSREKIYNYICSICTLKFKRRHYLLRHTTKSH